jgi:uncharacterized protein YicC (UPF0701 family)
MPPINPANLSTTDNQNATTTSKILVQAIEFAAKLNLRQYANDLVDFVAADGLAPTHVRHIHYLRYNFEPPPAFRHPGLQNLLGAFLAIKVPNNGLREESVQEAIVHNPQKATDLIEAMRLVEGHSLNEMLEEENPCEFHDHSDGSECPN